MKVPEFIGKWLNDDTEPQAKQTQQHPKVAAAPGSGAKQGGKKKKAKIVLTKQNQILCVAIGAVLFISLLTFPGGDSKKPSSSNEPQRVYVDFNTAVNIEGMRFSLSGVSATSNVPGDSKGKVVPAAGNTFYTVRVDVKNVGNTSSALCTSKGVGANTESKYYYALIYDGKYTYSAISQSGNQALLSNYTGTIIPLQTVSGAICFEVPKEVAESDASLAFYVSTSKGSCTWTVREAPAPVETTETPAS